MLRPLVRPLVRALVRSPMESRGLRPTLSLDFTNGGVTDSRVTYSGGANGTRVNSAGLIVAATTPRLDYNPVTLAPLGLLVEEARTNLLLRSAEFDNAAWFPADTTVTANAITAPDGTLTADKLVETTANTPHGILNTVPVTITAGAAYTHTCYFKAAERSFVRLQFNNVTFTNVLQAEYNLSTGVVTGSRALGTATLGAVSITDAGGGWYRCAISGIVDGASTTAYATAYMGQSASVFSYAGNTANDVYIWGAQFEAGSFPTSYDPTTSAALTRTADSGIISGAAFTAFYNQAGGSAVVQFDLTVVSGTRPIISFDDNTANERIELYATGTDLRMRVVDGGATQVDMSIGTVAANTTYKAAIAWAANDFAGCLNGGTVATDSSGTLPTPDRLRIGSDQAGNFQCGHDKTLQAFAQRLPNATLQGMTA